MLVSLSFFVHSFKAQYFSDPLTVHLHSQTVVSVQLSNTFFGIKVDACWLEVAEATRSQTTARASVTGNIFSG